MLQSKTFITHFISSRKSFLHFTNSSLMLPEMWVSGGSSGGVDGVSGGAFSGRVFRVGPAGPMPPAITM